MPSSRNFGRRGRPDHGLPLLRVSAQCVTAAAALTMPAPKNDVFPEPPWHCRGSSAGQFAGHDSGDAEERTSAATAPAGMFGCWPRISAATPAACGDAIEVPLIQTYLPP